MALQDTDLILIFDYIEGRLSPEEEALFEQKMRNNEEIRLEVEFYKKLSKGFRQQTVEALEEKANSIRENLPAIEETDLIDLELSVSSKPEAPQPEPAGIFAGINEFFRSTWVRYALPLALAMMVGVVWVSHRYSNSGLARKYFQLTKAPDPAGVASSVIMFEGYELFRQKKFEKALEKFLAIAPPDPYYSQARFFQAHCLFKMDRFAEAGAIFDEMIETGDYPGLTDLNELKWNSLMCDLASGEDNWQEKLEDVPPAYDEQQQRLQKDLRGIWREIALFFY